MRDPMIAVSILMCVPLVTRADPPERRQPTATKFDFAMIDKDCKMLVSELADLNNKKDPVSVVAGETGTTTCWRTKRAVHCEVKHDDPKSRGAVLDYVVRVDTAGLIEMANDVASSVVFIDPGAHLAVITDRSFRTAEVGDRNIPMIFTKVCKGYYLTYDEIQALQKKQ